MAESSEALNVDEFAMNLRILWDRFDSVPVQDVEARQEAWESVVSYVCDAYGSTSLSDMALAPPGNYEDVSPVDRGVRQTISGIVQVRHNDSSKMWVSLALTLYRSVGHMMLMRAASMNEEMSEALVGIMDRVQQMHRGHMAWMLERQQLTLDRDLRLIGHIFGVNSGHEEGASQ